MPDDIKTFVVQTLADLPQERTGRVRRYQRKCVEEQQKEREEHVKFNVSFFAFWALTIVESCESEDEDGSGAVAVIEV
jgi:hypothetical protein